MKEGTTKMSMPKFPNLECLTFEQAINSILTSIAMEEAALSHILNAEGEKVQYVLAKCADIKDVIAVNESVACLVEIINDLQLTLKSKMRLALSFSPTNKHCQTKQCKTDCKNKCCC